MFRTHQYGKLKQKNRSKKYVGGGNIQIYRSFDENIELEKVLKARVHGFLPDKTQTSLSNDIFLGIFVLIVLLMWGFLIF